MKVLIALFGVLMSSGYAMADSASLSDLGLNTYKCDVTYSLESGEVKEKQYQAMAQSAKAAIASLIKDVKGKDIESMYIESSFIYKRSEGGLFFEAGYGGPTGTIFGKVKDIRCNEV
ncbi:MAG: hypothetical protein R2827_02330 [Bdellovibrionales bacterium]